MRRESGFTLIELLTIIAIIGILGSLALTSFQVYRSDAAYSVAESTLRNARSALEASINNIDSPPGPVALVSQNTPGVMSDPSARAFLPAFQVPKNVKVEVSYDPTCVIGACQSEFVQIGHCFADEYTRWVRFGDGVDMLLEHVAGGGCS